MAMGQEFQGLPMEQLIGAPLKAACDANLNLAQTTADFIKTVGFDEEGKKIRTAEFSFNRPMVTHDENGNEIIKQEKVDIDVPLLAIVQIPSLKVDLVDITFDMEVKSSESSKEVKDSKGEFSGKAKIGIGPFSASVKVSGSVSSHKENTRSTDKSAKYHVQVKATDHGMPEGLARVLDFMNQAIAPNKIGQAEAIERPSTT